MWCSHRYTLVELCQLFFHKNRFVMDLNALIEMMIVVTEIIVT